jgi:MFS family permease
MAMLLAMTFQPSTALLVFFVVLFGLCMGTRGPIISSLSARYFAGPQVATIYGGIYSANAVGAAAGALTGGVLHDLTGGYRAGLAIALVFIVLAALPFWVVRELRNFR